MRIGMCLMMGCNLLCVCVAEVAHAHDLSLQSSVPRLVAPRAPRAPRGHLQYEVETWFGLSPCQRLATSNNRPPHEERALSRRCCFGPPVSFCSEAESIRKHTDASAADHRLFSTCVPIFNSVRHSSVGPATYRGRGQGHRGLFVEKNARKKQPLWRVAHCPACLQLLFPGEH